MGVPYAEVIGDPIAHSKSPIIHKFWLERLGMEGDYRRVQVKQGELAGYFENRRADPDWRGCNVTMPHKQAVLGSVSMMDLGSHYADAANTIVAGENGDRLAYNTDILAVADLVSALPHPDYSNYVATNFHIIGAGGAGRAAAMGVLRAGRIGLAFYNRSAEKARALATRVGYSADEGYGLDGLGPTQERGSGPEDQRYSDVIMNASSMGMEGYPDAPIDLREYHPDTIIFEMVYHPLETGLLRQARGLGMRTIDGLQMLVAQAGHAFELFFGAKAPREHDAELRELLTR